MPDTQARGGGNVDHDDNDTANGLYARPQPVGAAGPVYVEATATYAQAQAVGAVGHIYVEAGADNVDFGDDDNGSDIDI